MSVVGESGSVGVRVPRVKTGWSLSLCAAAGEAGGCFVAARKRSSGGGGPTKDPERAREEAGRRARARLRRYCAANRLNRLGTLTYRGEGCHDPAQARRDVGLFFRRLRADLGGEPFPYVWVPEWHKTGHGLHLHFAVGKFVPRGKIAEAWGHGFVHIKLLGDLPVGSGTLAESRAAAGYLSKYVAKTFTDAAPDVGTTAAGEGDDGVPAPVTGGPAGPRGTVRRPKGMHRFDVAQGFTPVRSPVWGVSREDVIERASLVMGARPEKYWFSDEVEGWQGPPAVWVQWAG